MRRIVASSTLLSWSVHAPRERNFHSAQALCRQLHDGIDLVRRDDALARVDVGRSKTDLLGKIDFHDRHEALFIGLLIDLHLDVARLHLLQYLGHEIEAAEQYLAGRDTAVSEHASDARMPVAGIEIGGGVRMGVQIGPDAVGDDRKVSAGIYPLDGDLAGGISLLV